MSLRARLREFFFREAAGRRIVSFSPAQLAAMRGYHQAAVKRLRAVEDLRNVGQATATLALLRQSALLLILSLLASKGDSIDEKALTPDAALERLAGIVAADRLETPPELASVLPLLASTDLLAIDRLPAAEASRKVDEFQSVVEWLATLVDLRSPTELKMERLFRVGLAGALLAAALVWLGISVLSPPDLALGRPVNAVGAAYGTTPDGAVDGDRSGAYGFHSPEHDSPWLAVDLGQRYAIGKVKVFGRADCCLDQSIPLALELSDNGDAYRKIAERTTPFGYADPWVIAVGGEPARYVRLRVERRSYLVLREVEVYGLKPR
jgi:NedA-like, galactose-binding domain